MTEAKKTSYAEQIGLEDYESSDRQEKYSLIQECRDLMRECMDWRDNGLFEYAVYKEPERKNH